ncbi:50S ribosomal protein L10 [Candidatus Woesebacteria bacterium RIFOXYC1_FULL_31_51]|uniref:Large ribosomal subunit protein uL10 n=1 Tax=Candidatus Woesebacteria bacterium GW2011_GWC2_31_9 TaxID=1618586 RepID=A0A0G0BMI0_9BACT|nr:MAG: 50S ribosomal protein L10, large subunit ribosomal protein L10 [Candidatus Woesebacteria bacterium GW2011_GWF1_31_35]KKP22846.1 MAG: 50S ribosomal protein L10 [Candidatus Woesebacteria bacterium GW2011_GWC1_30_29]KKP26666.1 MAG: 50S ribosomal protein L10 [Candidatus Woesebacteria bacterium GW2011_GWD1_31_12]KKP28094.1 MAG: 50S ribosomal protein L10 [Candidatus Woesebacteria bacterium GW2011_GWB1_31_29]KKP32237.1 MAG: 50S ribosomal protein L10 [Candidatus Woesebacteria bacterium GW2011_G
MNKQDKIDLVVSLSSKLKKAKSLVLVNYVGLSVSSQQILKGRLKEVNSNMVVVKNTLIKRAGIDAGISKDVLTDEVLSGQTAIVISEGDAIAPIQIIGKFAKEFSIPQFKVGIVEGSFQDKDSLTKLSNLPNKDILLSQVLRSLMSPSYGLIGVLQGNLQKLIYVLKEVSTRG